MVPLENTGGGGDEVGGGEGARGGSRSSIGRCGIVISVVPLENTGGGGDEVGGGEGAGGGGEGVRSSIGRCICLLGIVGWRISADNSRRAATLGCLGWVGRASLPDTCVVEVGITVEGVEGVAGSGEGGGKGSGSTVLVEMSGRDRQPMCSRWCGISGHLYEQLGNQQ